MPPCSPPSRQSIRFCSSCVVPIRGEHCSIRFLRLIGTCLVQYSRFAFLVYWKLKFKNCFPYAHAHRKGSGCFAHSAMIFMCCSNHEYPRISTSFHAKSVSVVVFHSFKFLAHHVISDVSRLRLQSRFAHHFVEHDASCIMQQ